MKPEYIALALASILGILQLLIAHSAAVRQRGMRWNMSSREETSTALTGQAGRLDRAFQNFKETFPLFLASVVLVTFAGKDNQVSQISAFIYVIARVIYVPVYAFGIVGLRSLIWAISLVGLLGVLLQVFT